MPLINTSLPGMEDEDTNYKELLLRQLQAQQQPPPPDNGGNNALIAGLNQSFSKLGTVGGKTADTSDVSRYANVLDQMRAAKQQQDMTKTGQQEKILGMLAQLKDKDIQKQNTLSVQQQMRADQLASKADDRAYQERKDAENRAFQREMQTQKGDQAIAQAQVKSDQKPTKAAEAVDKEFAKDYNDFVVKGGYGQVQKGIRQLNDVADMLSKDNSLTGPLAGRTPDFVRAFTNPDAIKARQQVEDVVQRSLKEILGAQFTEREGQQILARAYNPALDAETNRQNILRLATSLKTAAESKLNAAKYYEQNGTLSGFKGTVANSVDDILADLEGPKPTGSIAAQPAPSSDIKAMGMGNNPAPAQSGTPKTVSPQKLDAQAQGAKKIVGGKTYTKGADGLWYED